MRWSRLFRGRIRGLGLGRVRLAFHPVVGWLVGVDDMISVEV